jgi:hypothetical protein
VAVHFAGTAVVGQGQVSLKSAQRKRLAVIHYQPPEDFPKKSEDYFFFAAFFAAFFATVRSSKKLN